MTPETFIKARLAAFAYEEAADTGSANSMLAVACVMRNRVRKGWFSGDWMKVINAAKDSSPFALTERTEYDLNANAFRRALQEIDDVVTGLFEDDLTGHSLQRKDGGLYYMDACYAEKGKTVRPWFEQKILKDTANHPRIAQVGMLYIFA